MAVIYNKYQDIHIEDTQLERQFRFYFNAGNYSAAFDLVRTNNQLNNKAMVAKVLNNILQSIDFLESLYYTDVEDFLDEILSKFNGNINELLFKGEFQGNVVYKANNIVSYNGKTYICIKETTAGITPDNEEYWIEVDLTGRKGFDGIDCEYIGEWEERLEYYPKDVVIYNNIFYVAKVENTGKNPETSTDEWEVLLKSEKSQIYVQNDSDPKWQSGQIWFNILTNFTVSFNPDNGSTIPSQTVEENEKIKQPKPPVKSGFIFAGWYEDKDFWQPFNFDKPIDKDYNLIAKWDIDYKLIGFKTSDDKYFKTSKNEQLKVNKQSDDKYFKTSSY